MESTRGLHRVYGQSQDGVDHETTTSREESLHVVSAGRYPERTENDGLPRFGTNGDLDSWPGQTAEFQAVHEGVACLAMHSTLPSDSRRASSSGSPSRRAMENSELAPGGAN